MPPPTHIVREKLARYSPPRLLFHFQYIFDMIQCSDSADDPYKVVRYFILWSPAPLEISLKLAASYVEQSVRRKDRAKEFFMASRFCQKMGVDLTSVTTSIAATEDVGKVKLIMKSIPQTHPSPSLIRCTLAQTPFLEL